MASSVSDSLSAIIVGAPFLAGFTRSGTAEVSSQNQMYGKFPQMQEDSREILPEVSAETDWLAITRF
jgi:hypothetical protein